MASTTERKNDDSGIKISNKTMRRGKPQQQIYRPGSGPLRRSAHNVEDTESDTGLLLNSRQNYSKGTDKHSKQRSEGNLPREQSVEMDTIGCKAGDYSAKDDCRRRPKKPDQSFYVPKPVAQAQARESSSINRSNDNLSQFNVDNKNVGNKSEFINGNIGGSNEHLNTINTRSKRYSNRRRPSDIADVQERSWRTNSPVSSQRRDIRQGSEPRAISQHSNNMNWNRGMRDTRSVEPPSMGPVRNYASEKFHMKPPSGRRHSTIGLEPEKRPKNLESLPPRLRKKYLEDNKMNVNYIGTQSEGNWDGNSLVFQGSNQHPPPGSQHKFVVKQNYPNQPCVNMPMELQQQNLHIHNQHHQHHMPNNYQNVYYTLPHRGRGRARAQQDYDNSSVGGGFYRCVTPDRMHRGSPCNSRPATPPPFNSRTRSNENLHRSDSRPQTPVQFFRKDKYDRRPDDSWHEKVPRDRYGGQKNTERNSNKMSNNEKRFGQRNVRNVQEEEKSRNVGDDHQRTPVRTFRESLEAQLSPVSPVTPPEAQPSEPSINLVPVDNQILDWSEEVELQVRLEAEEAFSDAVTRSSSMTSLVETSTASQPPSSRKRNKRKSKRNRKRSGSKLRDTSTDKYPPKGREDHHRTRKNSQNSVDSTFKVPEGRPRRRRESRDRSYDHGGNRSRNVSRESSFDRAAATHNEPENWREEILRSRHNSERESSKEPEHKEHEPKKAGILILPHKDAAERGKPPVLNVERPRYPEIRKPTSPGQQQKSLFDPNNPSKPIIVKSSSARVSVPGFSEGAEGTSPPQLHQYTTDQFGNIRPLWYDEKSDGRKLCHFSALLNDIKKADYELQYINNSGLILVNWANVVSLRRFLMDSLEYLLCKDLKFCQAENVEQHFWKILYYNIIEMMRKTITNDPANKKQYNEFLLWVIDEGTKYFENLLDFLERTYKFKLNDYLGYNNLIPQKGLGYLGLALISAQKIFLFLGDLARYKEQVNETSNYGKCRQWYIKAHEINPKNGKPYNQLAVLAVYARRKLDAVYYYMRSLMSSNPVPSARESLISLFDENRKKYEQGERKRREERLEKARQHMKEKESEAAGPPGSLRREIWIRPSGGRRVHRTTNAIQEPKHVDSEEEDLAALTCLEVNKRFVTSYLHVHGKLITKIGMESFQEAALQMLKEFRALLQHSPMPLNCNRFLQLLALNMFAIESTQLKDPQFQDSSTGYRSELQERALVISLQMFNLILERSVSLLHDHIKMNPETLPKLTMNSLPQDFHMLLPAIKTWCDWMLCHSSVWNPPPSTQDLRVGPPGDAWSRLASLMNLLEKLDHNIASTFIAESREGFEQVRLPEDAVLSGFTPLMYNDHEPTFAPKDTDTEIAQCALRLAKVLFFGTVFLCGLEEPVLKLEMDNDFSEYVSVVSTSSNRDSSPSPPELADDDDLLVESFSEDEGDPEVEAPLTESASSEVRQLLSRKVELEKRQRTQELHRQRVQKILQQSVVSVHIEIRPKILVPDTNCFIDYLAMIKAVVAAHVYTLMVPLVVLNELEGLARGGKHPAPSPRVAADPQHVLKVADSAKQALEYLGNRHTNIKCVTTKGTTLPTFTFTVEEDSLADAALRNDDKILATCLVLCKNNKDQIAEGKEGEESVVAGDAKGVAEPRKLYREVVLLTEDRNLRVKALARDLPVRELPDFLQWAGLG